MAQSRQMSLVESVTNVSVGFVLAVLTQLAALPWFGVHLSVAGNFMLGGFTAVFDAPQLRSEKAVRTKRGLSSKPRIEMLDTEEENVIRRGVSCPPRL